MYGEQKTDGFLKRNPLTTMHFRKPDPDFLSLIGSINVRLHLQLRGPLTGLVVNWLSRESYPHKTIEWLGINGDNLIYSREEMYLFARNQFYNRN